MKKESLEEKKYWEIYREKHGVVKRVIEREATQFFGERLVDISSSNNGWMVVFRK